MRVLVGIVHDADDRNPVAADLAGNVAVEILRRHHGDFVVSGAGGVTAGKRKEQCKGEGRRLHDTKPLDAKCNNITYQMASPGFAPGAFAGLASTPQNPPKSLGRKGRNAT